MWVWLEVLPIWHPGKNNWRNKAIPQKVNDNTNNFAPGLYNCLGSLQKKWKVSSSWSRRFRSRVHWLVIYFYQMHTNLKYNSFYIGFIPFVAPRTKVEYKVLRTLAQSSSSNNYSRTNVLVIFQRRVEYHILNTFLQTFILMCIGFISFFFELGNFSDRIMVTLTTMLVVATLGSGIQEVRRPWWSEKK